FWNALPNNIDQNPARLWDWGERELETSSRACSAHKRRPSNYSVSEELEFGRPPRRLPLPRAWPMSGPGNNEPSLEAQGSHRIQFCSAVGRKQAKNDANETREDKCKQDDSRADHDRPFTIVGDCYRPYRPTGDSDKAAKQSQDRSFDQELIADILPSRAD